MMIDPPLSVEMARKQIDDSLAERHAFEAGMRAGKEHEDFGGHWEFTLRVPWSPSEIDEAFEAYLAPKES